MRVVLPFFTAGMLLCFMLPSVHANDLDLYQIKGNLFNDYKPGHQRANPGADYQRMKEREAARMERSADSYGNRSRSYGGTIDNRDYSGRSRRSQDSHRYHSNDRMRSRHAGNIDNNRYGATAYKAPPLPKTYNNVTPGNSPAARYENRPLAGNKAPQNTDRYYGTRSGESLYPYTSKPVKGTFAEDAAKNKSKASLPATNSAYYREKPRDPSYGGNKAWHVPSQNKVNTRRYFEDEIAAYRKAHKPQAYCRDGATSGQGSGACSAHGGLLRRF